MQEVNQGTVWFVNKNEDGALFGEIKPSDGGENIMLYISEAEDPKLAGALKPGVRVEYGLRIAQIYTGGLCHRGPRAVNIQIIQEEPKTKKYNPEVKE